MWTQIVVITRGRNRIFKLLKSDLSVPVNVTFLEELLEILRCHGNTPVSVEGTP